MKRYSKYLFVALQILVPLFFGLYALWLGQDINWDLQNYHLYGPFALFQHRLNFDLAPAGVQTYLNPLLDVPYYWAISHFSPKLCGFMLGFIQGLNFILLFNICLYCLKDFCLKYKTQALALSLLGIMSVGFLSEIGTTMGDSLVSLFVLSSLLIIIKSLKAVSGQSLKYPLVLIFLAGLLIGLGTGLKLTVAIYAAALAFSFLFISATWAKRISVIVVFGLGAALGLLATGGAWYYHIWQQFGNPVFPMFNNIFHGSLAPNLPIRDARFLPTSFIEAFFYPIVFTFNPLRVAELRYVEVNWLLMYLGIIILFINRILFYFKRIQSRSLTPEIKYVIIFFCTSYLLWLNLFGIYRYTIAIEILIPLIVFTVFNYVFQQKWSGGIIIVLLLSATVFNLQGIANWGHSTWTDKIFNHEVKIETLSKEPIGAIILIGQPLAWLAPVLDLKVPVVQIWPNFPVTLDYWQRAKSIIANAGGKSLVIFDSSVVNQADIISSLNKVDITINTKDCKNLKAYFGGQEYIYKTCLK